MYGVEVHVSLYDIEHWLTIGEYLSHPFTLGIMIIDTYIDRILEKSRLDEEWGIATIIIIHKKKDVGHCESYREEDRNMDTDSRSTSDIRRIVEKALH